MAAFFAIFTSAFSQIYKLWTNLCLLITSLALLFSPIFKTSQCIVKKSSAVLDNITHGYIRTQLYFKKLLITLEMYLKPLCNRGYHVTEIFRNFTGSVRQLFYYMQVALYDILANTCRMLFLPMTYIFSLFISKRTVTIAKEDEFEYSY